MKNRWGILFFSLVIILIAAGVTGYFIYRWREDRIKSALNPPNTPLSVLLNNPLDGSRWPQDAGMSVQTVVQSGVPVAKLQLWLDGSLLTEKSFAGEEAKSPIFTRWEWPPASVGNHIMQVRAEDTKGRLAVSNTVRVTVSKPAGYTRLVKCQPNETVSLLSQRLNITPDQLYNANQDFNPQTPDQQCKDALLPVPPEDELPIAKAPELAPPSGTTIEQVKGLSGGADPEVPIDQLFLSPATAPEAPQVYAQSQGCDVNITIEDRSNDETGFYIERVDSTSQIAQRIATLESHSDATMLGFSDPMMTGGLVQYTVYAFNAAGSSPSAPAAVEVNADGCQPAKSGGAIQSKGKGIKTIPPQSDLAYFYYTSGGAYKRYPSNPKEFIQPGDTRDIASIMQELQPDEPAPISAGQLWYWVGTDIETNDFEFGLPSSITTICPSKEVCSYGDSVQRAVLKDNNRIRRVWWYNYDDSVPISELIWQVSDEPFEDNVLYPNSLIDGWVTGKTSSANPIYRDIDFTKYHNHCAYDEVCQDIHRYVRVIPFHDDQPASLPGKQVEVIVSPLPPDFKGVPPSIYGVEMYYNAPKIPSPKYWGCIFINGDYNNGICPPLLEEPSDFGLLVTGIWDGVMTAWETAIVAINDAKNEVINAVVSIGDQLSPGWCGGTCRDRLMTGLNFAISAFTGLPPNLPSFQALVDDGINYAIQMAADEMGVPCDETCQGAIRDGIKKAADAVAGTANSSACNSAEANQHGREGWCPSFPPGTVIEPAADGIYQNAEARVRISHYTTEGSRSNSHKYAVQVTSWIDNEWMADKDYRLCGYYNGDVSHVPGVTYPINGSLNKAPFETQTIAIPWIDPGSYIDIPVILKANPFEIKGHKLMVHNALDTSHWDNCIIDDWPLLYYGGQLKVTATVMCENSQGGMVPCQDLETQCYQSVGNSKWEYCTNEYEYKQKNENYPYWYGK